MTKPNQTPQRTSRPTKGTCNNIPQDMWNKPPSAARTSDACAYQLYLLSELCQHDCCSLPEAGFFSIPFPIF